MAAEVWKRHEPWPRRRRYARALRAMWRLLTGRFQDTRQAHCWVWYGD